MYDGGGRTGYMKYQRFISYLYQYRGVEKLQNTGFVKVEQKGGMIRLSLRSKLMERREQEYYIFLIEKKAENQQEYQGILLDRRFSMQGILAYRYGAEQERFSELYHSMEDFVGVLIRGHDEGMYMTLWKDVDVLPEQIRCMEQREVQDKPEQEDEESRFIEGEEGIEAIEGQPEMESPGNKQQTMEQPEIEQEELKGQDIEQQGVEEKENIFDVSYLFRNRNPLPAVEGSQLLDCIRIEPRDLGLLPMQNWKYGGNSFLNHSYMRYHYLLLGKLKFQDDSEKIILGVPSIYTSREKYLANMFGFDQFVTARRTDRKIGQFGYWIAELV